MERNTLILLILLIVIIVCCVFFILFAVLGGFTALFNIDDTEEDEEDEKDEEDEENKEKIEEKKIETIKFDKYDIPGFDMPNMPTKNIMSNSDCHQLCKDNNDCMFSTWNRDNKYCYLKKGTPKENCTLVGSGFQYNNTDIYGLDLPNMPIKNVESAEQCREKCLQNPDCHVAAYNIKNCYLKKGKVNNATIYQFKPNL